ncbi:MAG: immune inhibitor A [Taibaiella sp.]|nr:immune inhibitor A [Taibaiella sp.]
MKTVGYVTNGDSDDWMYDEQSTKDKIFSLTPEAGSYEDGFWPMSSRIIPIAKNTLQQNLFAARLAGAYCEVKPEPFPALTTLDNDILIHFKRTGIDPGGSYTVSLVPVSSNILSVGDPRIYTATEIGMVLSDSIALHLDAGTPLNEEVIYAIKWQHSSGFELSDTFHTRYAILDTIYYNACDHMESMSGSWDVSMTEFTSAPGSFTETPAGNYPPNSSIATTTGEWIDLEDVSAALLTFQARWQIEKGFDYVELEAIVEGGGSTTLCGLYTNKGNDNQNNVAAMYDGAQPAWVKEMIDLSAFAGERIKLRYTLNSDPGLEMDGFYVDDITVLSNYDTTLSVLNSNDEDIVATCYPNPARDEVHIQYQLRHLDPHAAFWLTDMTGRRWSEMRLDPASQQQTIDVSALPSGIYFYQIRTTDGRSAVGKLVIRH